MTLDVATLAVHLLAAGSESPSGEPAPVDPSQVTPGVVGFLVVLALGVATYLLIRSMNGHLRNISSANPPPPDTRIPPGPPREPDPPRPPPQ